MIPLTLRQVRHAVGGRALNLIRDENAVIESVSTNSKEISKSCLFIAIKGEKFDGHDFLKEAEAAGAAAAIVSTVPSDSTITLPLIFVPDTRVALGRLAKHVRQTFRAKVIDVAGSNGKTSTKHLIHAALRGRLRGTISPKSFNNDIGVPLTILPTDPQQDYLVLEVGTNHPGEIQPLSDMSLPDIAVITNCGADHLEGLGDLAGVRRENAQIISGLNPSGLLIVNGDDPKLLAAVGNWTGKRVTFGLNPSNDLFATDIVCTLEGTSFSINRRNARVTVPHLGRHAAVNALAAIAVGRARGLPEEAIVESLAGADQPEMRLQVQRFGAVTVLNDAYNANPNSMRAAIETLSELSWPGRRVAILGDMREMGDSAEAYHREIGSLVASTANISALVCVGSDSHFMADASTKRFDPSQLSVFADAATAARAIPNLLQEGDLVLLKASRGVRLERVAEAINAHFLSGARAVAS